MNDTKDKPVEDGNLPIERVMRVGEYFRSLFVRSLKLGLDDGVRERPWETPAVPTEVPRAAGSLEAESAATAGSDGPPQKKGNC